MDEAWELLEGAETELKELAELVFDAFTPETAWAAWLLVADGLYFSGTPERILPRSREEIERDRVERDAKARAQAAWEGLLGRLRAGRMDEADREALVEVERLALGASQRSRVMQALSLPETSPAAHRMLCKVGYWTPEHNPIPARFGVELADPELAVPELPADERLDLTHLASFAIDDEGNRDPDDAIALDGEHLWVHVADVAALVAPGGDLDLEARSRGANLYLPELTVNMLPMTVTERLGLGLQEISPALSFRIRVGDNGDLSELSVHRTRVRVERLSYEAAENEIEGERLAAMVAITQRFAERRRLNNAVRIDLPEVSLKVDDAHKVSIRALPRLASRQLVSNAMLMAGEAAARICREQAIAIPYVTQPAPEKVSEPQDLAAMFAYRRQLKPSRTQIEPGAHFGLGLPAYTRVTSPLRRYADLLVHQQLGAWLRGDETLDAKAISERAGEADVGSLAIRRTERQSNQHWKLVYLRQHPRWSGEAVVVELGERKATLLIEALAFEVRVRLGDGMQLNERLRVVLREVDLAEGDVYFQVLTAS